MSPSTPEAHAREKIDRLLADCGWEVQDAPRMNLFASEGVAVREFPMRPGQGEAGYLLYAGGKALGVVEAKPEGWTLLGEETQSGRYLDGLPEGIPAYRRPLPFAYESTGTETRFTSALEPDARSREVFAFHRPEELVRLAGLDAEGQVRALLRRRPPLTTEGLWPAQIEAVTNLERSLAENKPRSLIQMATGAGETFTAVSAVYRLVKFAGAKRVLSLAFAGAASSSSRTGTTGRQRSVGQDQTTGRSTTCTPRACRRRQRSCGPTPGTSPCRGRTRASWGSCERRRSRAWAFFTGTPTSKRGYSRSTCGG